MDAQELRNLQEAYLEVVENQQLDEAEGSYGQTPKARAAYTALATGKGKIKTKSLALKHAIRAAGDDNSDKPSPKRSKMTQSDRDYHRGQSENGGEDREGIDFDEFDTGASGPGGMPKGKKLERQKKRGISAESFDLYDIILSHLLDEGYAETPEAAEVIMVNMGEEWRESIVEATVLAAKGGVAGAVQVKQTKTPGFLGTGIGSKTVSTPIPGTFTRNTPERVKSGPRPFDAYGSGSTGAKAEMGDRSGPTDAERSRFNAAVTKNNTVGDKSVEPSPKAVNQRANQKGHSGLMPTRDNQNSTKYTKPNQSWRGY